MAGFPLSFRDSVVFYARCWCYSTYLAKRGGEERERLTSAMAMGYRKKNGEPLDASDLSLVPVWNDNLVGGLVTSGRSTV
jgi:hypothetical protein